MSILWQTYSPEISLIRNQRYGNKCFPLHMLIDNGGLFSYVEYYEIPLDAREQQKKSATKYKIRNEKRVDCA